MKITKQKNKNVEVSQNRGDSTTRAMDLCIYANKYIYCY